MDTEEHHTLARISQRLMARFPTVPAADIAELIARLHGRFTTARIRSYVPLLVENLARDALTGRVRAPRTASHLSSPGDGRAFDVSRSGV